MLLIPAAASAAPPANDDFADAAELVGDSDSANGTVAEATAESGEPEHAGDSAGTSVWYRWKATRSGLARVHCEGEFAAAVAVYVGPSVDQLTEVGSLRNGDHCGESLLHFRAAGGLEYRIAVDRLAAAGSAFDLDIENTSERPMNDDFASAVPLGGNASRYATTEGAGREPGEPLHGGSPIGSSVWFTWTAQRTGLTRIFACRGTFHPVIEVYTGSSVSTLTRVGTPGDVGGAEAAAPRCSLGGRGGASFPAIAGQTYRVAVDGANGLWGMFDLTQYGPPIIDTVPPGTWIRKRMKVRKRTAKIEFFSNEPESQIHFLCKLDRRRFAPCASPKSYRRLSRGKHRFQVVAVDAFGNRDATPAVRQFRIVKPRRKRRR